MITNALILSNTEKNNHLYFILRFFKKLKHEAYNKTFFAIVKTIILPVAFQYELYVH